MGISFLYSFVQNAVISLPHQRYQFSPVCQRIKTYMLITDLFFAARDVLDLYRDINDSEKVKSYKVSLISNMLLIVGVIVGIFAFKSAFLTKYEFGRLGANEDPKAVIIKALGLTPAIIENVQMTWEAPIVENLSYFFINFRLTIIWGKFILLKKDRVLLAHAILQTLNMFSTIRTPWLKMDLDHIAEIHGVNRKIIATFYCVLPRRNSQYLPEPLEESLVNFYHFGNEVFKKIVMQEQGIKL